MRLVDGRDMVPPEPLERTLAELEEAQEGEEVVLLLYRSPRPLYDILRRDGCTWQELRRDDGVVEIRIRRGPAAG